MIHWRLINQRLLYGFASILLLYTRTIFVCQPYPISAVHIHSHTQQQFPQYIFGSHYSTFATNHNTNLLHKHTLATHHSTAPHSLCLLSFALHRGLPTPFATLHIKPSQVNPPHHLRDRPTLSIPPHYPQLGQPSSPKSLRCRSSALCSITMTEERDGGTRCHTARPLASFTSKS